MSIKRLAFTAYPVTDIPRAVAFYHEVLGLAKGGIDLPYWVEFDVDGACFGVGNFEQIGKAGTARSLALEVANIHDFCKVLAARGASPAEPHDLKNCWISSVSDPDGNLVYLHQSKHAG